MNKKNNKGFTLAEMLIVVAIIGILIAILVPSMTSNLEKSREAADAANIRSVISELTVCYLNGDKDSATGVTAGTDGSYTKSVTITQTVSGWTTVTEISGYTCSGTGQKIPAVVKGNTLNITVDKTGAFTFALPSSN